MITRMNGITVVVLAAIAVVLAGCGGGTKHDGPLSVSLTDAGCSPARLDTRSGPATIQVTGTSTKVTELELKTLDGIILAEREHVGPGRTGSFALDLAPGTYVLSCPNGSTAAAGRLVVSGKSIVSVAQPNSKLVLTATSAYHAYVQREADRLLARTKLFVRALQAGNLVRAKALFGSTRYYYEEIEPVAESFGDLDPSIDARVNDVANDARWTGFHRIEQILWVGDTTKGTAAYATKLLNDVATLDYRIVNLTFQPAQLANGAVELLNEVANTKITGEEDRYSHTDLSDFAANLAGAQKAFELLRPLLVARGERRLATTITARFDAVTRGLDPYRRPTSFGYAYYSAVTAPDRRLLAQAVDALAEPLSGVAAKVAG